ncbi:MAG: hypothetical protein AAB675_02000 [Patescibacteria group bacterium]
MINIFLITTITFILAVSVAVTVYNFLFFYQAKKTEGEINIIFPSILKKLLLFNLAISISAIVFAAFTIVKII